jgi:transcriptional regulator with XRE-family HTH domain
MVTTTRPVGELLRGWRRQRRRSQLDLALDADVSARHISFLETGRSQPSREMLLRLAEQLDVPLRDRNTLMVAAGYAPVYPATALDDPSLRVVRDAVERILTGHEPYPALAIDRHWNLVMANRAVGLLLDGVAPELLEPPVNVLRVSLHPAGLAPRIVNAGVWREHILARLERHAALTADPVLAALLDDLRQFDVADVPTPDARDPFDSYGGLVLLLRLRAQVGVLSFFTTTTVFGTANDITLSELAIESFFPADALTAEALRRALPP